MLLCGALLSLVACADVTAGPTTTTSVGTVLTTIPASVDTAGDSVPETGSVGVPGLDDPDAFCAAWAVYGGTLQAIGVAQAFGGLSSLEVARLEVVASAALVASVDAVGRHWPADILGDQSVVLTNLVGPYGRRAQKALTMLTDAGATELQLQQFRQLWDDALRSRRADEPVITLAPLPSELEDLVKVVAAQFDAAVTPFADDPSLNVDSVEVPRTYTYLAEHCPDLASSGLGDAV